MMYREEIASVFNHEVISKFCSFIDSQRMVGKSIDREKLNLLQLMRSVVDLSNPENKKEAKAYLKVLNDLDERFYLVWYNDSSNGSLSFETVKATDKEAATLRAIQYGVFRSTIRDVEEVNCCQVCGKHEPVYINEVGLAVCNNH